MRGRLARPEAQTGLGLPKAEGRQALRQERQGDGGRATRWVRKGGRGVFLGMRN